ncbi:unnamed protein product, partial [Polarella glacialis]
MRLGTDTRPCWLSCSCPTCLRAALETLCYEFNSRSLCFCFPVCLAQLSGRRTTKITTITTTTTAATTTTTTRRLHPAWGKLLFSALDLAAALLLKRWLEAFAPKDHATTRVGLALWLFNPFCFTISTRGSGESAVVLLVYGSLCALHLWKDLTISAVLFGLAVHWRVYPIVFALPILLGLRPDELGLRRLLHWPAVRFGLTSGGVFLTLAWVFYSAYGIEYLECAYLHHGRRRDPQHNFSIYFYPTALHLEGAFGGSVPDLARFAALPQLLLCAWLGWRTASFGPAVAPLLQALALVATNKVVVDAAAGTAMAGMASLGLLEESSPLGSSRGALAAVSSAFPERLVGLVSHFLRHHYHSSDSSVAQWKALGLPPGVPSLACAARGLGCKLPPLRGPHRLNALRWHISGIWACSPATCLVMLLVTPPFLVRAAMPNARTAPGNLGFCKDENGLVEKLKVSRVWSILVYVLQRMASPEVFQRPFDATLAALLTLLCQRKWPLHFPSPTAEEVSRRRHVLSLQNERLKLEICLKLASKAGSYQLPGHPVQELGHSTTVRQ